MPKIPSFFPLHHNRMKCQTLRLFHLFILKQVLANTIQIEIFGNFAGWQT